MSSPFTVRTFNSSKPILSASERSADKRKIAIYNELKKNLIEYNSANPVKTNGFTYNRNTIDRAGCDISNGSIDFANSYEILSAMKEGAGLSICPPLVAPINYESWSGNFYSVDYVAHGVDNVFTADASLNKIVIDPSHVLFYDSCNLNYSNINRPEPWIKTVDIP